ncbi:hypothetical protein [Arthrobacter sp. SX1312]|uniref:hypothetical protein n=1 Tax=Arthrobacter sp. SX1312 TaxID=2058896 RepID=UPI000CE55618|nr:hypothetical protein [Arthrobacter sp. SX1312]
MNRTRAKITAVLATAVLAAGLTPSAAFAHGGSGDSGSSEHESSREVVYEIRESTERYRSMEKAIRDGYVTTQPVECVEAPGLGAMGVHFVKGSLLDERIDASKPEALVYMPRKLDREGKYTRYRLVAVEFLSTALEAPVLGGVKFDSEPAGSTRPFKHSLHAWVWKYNPEGKFAPWNPSISCPKEKTH